MSGSGSRRCVLSTWDGVASLASPDGGVPLCPVHSQPAELSLPRGRNLGVLPALGLLSGREGSNA